MAAYDPLAFAWRACNPATCRANVSGRLLATDTGATIGASIGVPLSNGRRDNDGNSPDEDAQPLKLEAIIRLMAKMRFMALLFTGAIARKQGHIQNQ